MSRPGKVLFSDVSLTINSGDRIGIVGLNGAGKTTLLRILSGDLEPDAGVVRSGRGVQVATLDQQPDLPDGSARAAVGDSWEADAVLDRLGLGDRLDAEIANMSGGERRRVALARALVSPCDLLVLDEPTNHLDIDAVDWLEERLAGFAGGLLLVTHDRHLLDAVTTRVVEVDNGSVFTHEGGYDSYLENKIDRIAASEEAETVRRNLARREQEWLRRGAPARTRKSKAHIARAEAVINTRPEAVQRGEPLQLHRGTPRLGKTVIELEGVGATIGDRVLFEDIELRLSNNERLGIVGPNGAGKSTLLDIMVGRREATTGEVIVGTTVQLGYFDQTGRTLDPNMRVRDAITNGEREPDWRDAALLETFWFDTDTQWAPIQLLSGGERRRLQLVLTLAEQPNVLLLDEPTNDLDLDTLRALEDFLDEWPGALVVVSHDRAFLERTVDDVIVLDGSGGAGRYVGGLAAWVDARRAARRRGHAGPSSARAPQPKGAGKKDRDSSGRSKSTIRHELKAAEKEMAKLEKQQQALTDELVAAGDDHAALRALGDQLATTQDALAASEDRWLELSSELEDS